MVEEQGGIEEPTEGGKVDRRKKVGLKAAESLAKIVGLSSNVEKEFGEELGSNPKMEGEDQKRWLTRIVSDYVANAGELEPGLLDQQENIVKYYDYLFGEGLVKWHEGRWYVLKAGLQEVITGDNRKVSMIDSTKIGSTLIASWIGFEGEKSSGRVCVNIGQALAIFTNTIRSKDFGLNFDLLGGEQE